MRKEVRNLAFIPRWSILRTIKDQSVAEHSYYVALYSLWVADIAKWDGDRGQLLEYALKHDWDEVVSGDIPAPIKYAVDKAAVNQRLVSFGMRVNGVDEEIRTIVKLADLFEGVMYLVDEIRLGNQEVEEVKNTLMYSLGKLAREYNDDVWRELVQKIHINEKHAPRDTSK